MKSKPLSILSGTDESSAADAPVSSQQIAANYRARYQAFLNQQAQRPQRSSNTANSLVRFVQAVLSFSIFVVMFLTILTLFGFGLSKLGVIAQVSDGAAAVSVPKSPATTDAAPTSAAPKRKSRHK